MDKLRELTLKELEKAVQNEYCPLCGREEKQDYRDIGAGGKYMGLSEFSYCECIICGTGEGEISAVLKEKRYIRCLWQGFVWYMNYMRLRYEKDPALERQEWIDLAIPAKVRRNNKIIKEAENE